MRDVPTQASITRAIKAALKAGLVVTGVRPDGTVLTAMPGSPAAIESGGIDPNDPEEIVIL